MAGLLLAGLAVVALLLAGADLLATALAENRTAAAVSDALGMDTQVEIGPWPAAPRLLARRELQVDLRATPRRSPPDDGALLRSLDLRLTGATAAADWSSFAARGADWSLALDPERAALGLAQLSGTAEGVAVAVEDSGAVTTISADSVTLDPPPGGGNGRNGVPRRALTAATGRELTLRLDGRDASTAITAAHVSVDLAASAERSLPLEVQAAAVQLERLQLLLGGGRAIHLRADSGTLAARGVPLDVDGVTDTAAARLEALDARLPMLAVDHDAGAAQVVITSQGAVFSTGLDADDLAQLWTGPGTVSLSGGNLQLVLGPLTVAVDVRPEGRLLLLTPLLPAPLDALLGEVAPVVVAPELPEGVVLTAVEVVDGALQLRGGGDRIVVPIG